MRINKIRIEGFKDKDRIVELDFSKTPITILYGDNGCGKTTWRLEGSKAVFKG